MSLYSGFKPIPFQLSPEMEADILDQTAQEILDALPTDILDAYPGFKTPGMKTPPANVRLANYTAMTVPEDFPLIRHPGYVDQYKRGLLPAPLSPMWNTALGMPPVFKLLQEDFNKVYDQLVGGE